MRLIDIPATDGRSSEYYRSDHPEQFPASGRPSVYKEVDDLSAILRLAVRTHSGFRLYPDPIVDGVANPLFAAKVSFRCLHRHMSK
jgi:hypothetical protein